MGAAAPRWRDFGPRAPYTFVVLQRVNFFHIEKKAKTAMRGAMACDVAAERRLDVIKDLLEVLPRSRGFRVNADGSVSVYPASSRARLSLLQSRRATPGCPSVHRAQSRRGASVLRTHAPAAALNARRSAPRGVSRPNFACSSSPATVSYTHLTLPTNREV